MVDMQDLPGMNREQNETVRVEMNAGGGDRRGPRNRGNEAEVQREMLEELRSRSVWWVVGTSLAFEAVVLLIAAWIFCRRDY